MSDAPTTTPRYVVERHGGRANTDWRERYASPDRAVAEAWFAGLRDRVRQGGVRLRAPDGAVLREYHAPRLRTRW
jgi:hypothetical protein